MTKLNITGVKPGSTSLELTAGTVTKNSAGYGTLT